MTAVFLISISGWIAVNLIGLEVVLPYVYRRGWLSRWLRVERFFKQPYLARLWPHYWLGYLLLALSVLHSACRCARADCADRTSPEFGSAR